MMARAYGAKVTALHVVVPSISTYMAGEMSASVLNAEDDTAQMEMGRVQAELAGLANEVIIRRDTAVWPSLAKFLHEREVDLIVLGIHGHTRIEESDIRFNRREVFRRTTVGAHGWTGRAEACPQRCKVSVRASCHRFQFRFERRDFVYDVSVTGKPIQTGSSARAASAEIGKEQQIRRPLGS
jgi:hypothetical protein